MCLNLKVLNHYMTQRISSLLIRRQKGTPHASQAVAKQSAKEREAYTPRAQLSCCFSRMKLKANCSATQNESIKSKTQNEVRRY